MSWLFDKSYEARLGVLVARELTCKAHRQQLAEQKAILAWKQGQLEEEQRAYLKKYQAMCDNERKVWSDLVDKLETENRELKGYSLRYLTAIGRVA